MESNKIRQIYLHVVPVKNCRFTTCPRFFDALLDFQKMSVFSKTIVHFLELNRKHIFTASDIKTIKSKIFKKNLEEHLSKKIHILIQTFICIIFFGMMSSNHR